MPDDNPKIPEIGPAQLKGMLARADAPCLLDVRELQEWNIGRIAGALHIPMNTIPARLGELPRDRAIVCYCHHGMRSSAVAGFLMQNGFENVFNLNGGIDAWSLEADPSVARY